MNDQWQTHGAPRPTADQAAQQPDLGLAPANGGRADKQPWTYWGMWRHTGQQLLVLLSGLIVGVAVPAICFTLMVTGGAMLFLVLGLLLVIAALYVARFYGQLQVEMLGWAGVGPIEKPTWPDSGMPWLERFKTVLTSAIYWRYTLYTMVQWVVAPIFAAVALTWSMLVASLPVAIVQAMTTGNYSFGDGTTALARALHVSPTAADLGLAAVATVFTLGTLPFVCWGLTWLQAQFAKLVLSPTGADRLRAESRRLEQARIAAVNTEGRSLRALERDIHDGPQQQLLRLQMDLAAAQRRMVDDPEGASEILAQTQQLAAETLDGLRSLSKGIAPPLLQDRGLVPALQDLVNKAPVAARLTHTIANGQRFEPALEQNLYFTVSELLTNAAKHSGADEVTVALTAIPGGLALQVADNGRGGAHAGASGGLFNLVERVLGLGGTLNIDSPIGGPTRIDVTVPA